MRTGGNGIGPLYNNEIFYEARHELLSIKGRMAENAGVPDTDDLKIMVEDLQKRFQKYAVFFALYDKGEWIIPPPGRNRAIVEAALLEEGDHTISFDTTALYTQTIGAARIMTINYDYRFNDDMYSAYIITAGIVSFWLVIVLVLATNFFLTRAMIKNIVMPLNTLSFGVAQIQNNNLNFRLDYSGDDEFSPVCSAFNAMAERLQHMGRERQKDEESRRELIAGISHDLRTPLTVIKAYLEGIEEKIAATPERQKKYIETIKAKTGDMERIINQLFLFSKLEIDGFPMNLQIVNAGKVIRGMTDDFIEEYKHKGITLKLESGEAVPKPEVLEQPLFIKADVQWLHNVFINILENSVKYRDRDTGNVFIYGRTANPEGIKTLEIHIQDDGPGVPPETLEKLFAVFYRGDSSRSKKGSGLGLAISEKIIQRMGGAIRAEAGPCGRGLDIVIAFPAVNGGGAK
jgi:signal transduction histidine kinase